MGIRLHGQNMSAMLIIAILSAASLVLVGCTLNRSALGCELAADDSGRCVGIDAGPVDAYVMMTDGDIRDAGQDAPDAFLPDAELPDGGLDGGPPDGGPPDSGPPDGGPPDGGPLDGGPPDAGFPTGPLHINFNAATGVTGIAFQVWWIMGPGDTRYSAWYYHRPCRRFGASIMCERDAPELASGRMIDFLPFDDSAGAATCTAATCPSLCTRSECPGYPPMGTFAYSASYSSVPVLDGEIVINADPGTASDGPAPNHSAGLRFRLP
ncbi:hypothetical protein IT087_02125 [Candidatus Uhrbacteria bacterium]|nr:hypothetical protein [Candidatus Uhrbacteria bacterium]